MELKSAEPPKCIVRIRTNAYLSKGVLTIKRTIRRLARKSTGFNFFNEEIGMVGADEVAGMIVNLSSVEDGEYQLVLCDIRTDWETGHVDGYKLKLVAP